MKLEQGNTFTARIPVFTEGARALFICDVKITALVLKVGVSSSFAKRISFLVTKSDNEDYYEVGKVYSKNDTTLIPRLVYKPLDI